MYVQYFRVWGLLKNNREEIVNKNCNRKDIVNKNCLKSI